MRKQARFVRSRLAVEDTPGLAFDYFPHCVEPRAGESAAEV